MCSTTIQKINNVAHKFESLKFSYKGFFDAFSNSTSLGPMFSSWSFNMVVISSCCMPSPIHDMLEYASIGSSSMAYSTCPPTFG
jgi:hypothetical protein